MVNQMYRVEAKSSVSPNNDTTWKTDGGLLHIRDTTTTEGGGTHLTLTPMVESDVSHDGKMIGIAEERHNAVAR